MQTHKQITLSDKNSHRKNFFSKVKILYLSIICLQIQPGNHTTDILSPNAWPCIFPTFPTLINFAICSCACHKTESPLPVSTIDISLYQSNFHLKGNMTLLCQWPRFEVL